MLLSVLLSVWFVGFADKGGSQRIALSKTALAMREAQGIAIDSLDYAVSDDYLDSIRSMGAHIFHTSRWMNGATVEADNSAIQRIKNLPFVQYVEQTRDDTLPSPLLQQRRDRQRETAQSADYGFAREQLMLYNLLPLHEAGFKGQGIRMAIIDGGFQNVNTLQAFDSVRAQLIGYYDFTDDTYDFFGETGSHGTMCLSTIAARMEDYEGAATQAHYYLMRTEEYDTESPKELDNWVSAIELADSLGIQITSTSLGYSEFDNEAYNFTYADMDGVSNRGSRAATIAARKGMLVVVAAGNEGNKAWKYITAPADADSILTVGAVNHQGAVAAFSSYGPTWDGRVKPEACAVGWGTALVNPNDGAVAWSNGTSFACPLLAGLAACLWSALPDESAMQIRERIIRSADRLNTPDDHYGYGIPDAWAAYTGSTDVVVPDATDAPIAAYKVLRNGTVYIIANGKQYSLSGFLLRTVNECP